MSVSGPATRRAFLGRWLGVAAGAALVMGAFTGCGFQMRRSAALPFKRLYTNFSPTSQIGAEFRRRVRISRDTVLVDDPKQADARLEVLAETREREIVAFSSTGRAREFELRIRFVFRVVAANGAELLPPTEMLLRRDIIATDIEIVAKQAEEELLYRDMQSDLVQQLLRRLEAIKPPPAAEGAAVVPPAPPVPAAPPEPGAPPPGTAPSAPGASLGAPSTS